MNNFETYNKVVAVGIDMQNDFMPGGSLAVENGDSVVFPFNEVAKWVRNQHNGMVAFTRDWHPEVTNHFGNPPNFETTWPVHCVANTIGANYHPELDVLENDIELIKGTLKDEDAYSGFQAHGHFNVTLESLLSPIKHDRVAVVIGGLATDYCVKATLLDAKKLAYHLFDHERTLDVYALTDAMMPVAKKTGELAMEAFKEVDIRLITSEQLIMGSIMKVEELV